MDSPVRFRTSLFGGYNTADVIAFIKEESKTSREALEQKDLQIEDLKQQLADAEGKLEAEKKKDQAEWEEKLRVKETVMDGLTAENADLKAKLAELEDKFDKLSRSCESIAEEKQYLVDLEIAARKRADAVEEASTRRVEELTARVQEGMAGAEKKLSAFSESAESQLQDLLSGLARYSETLRDFSGAFAETRQAVLSSVNALELPEETAGKTEESPEA